MVNRHANQQPRAHNCVECVTLNSHRGKHDSTLHCVKHACPATNNHGHICGKKKATNDYGCMLHLRPPPPPPVCGSDGCSENPSKPSLFCKSHKCVVTDCHEISDVRAHRYFCVNHKCKVLRCQGLRKLTQVGETFEPASYCLLHECLTDSCSEMKVSRGHCSAHYCTSLNCASARDPNLHNSTFCFEHFSLHLRDEAIATARRDFDKQFKDQREQADIEAMRKALAQDLAEKKKRREEQAEETIVNSYKLKLAEDEERRAREQESETNERKYCDRGWERKQPDHWNYRPQENTKSHESLFYEDRASNDAHARCTCENGHSRPSATNQTSGEYYTSIPHRTVPQEGIHKDADKDRGHLKAERPEYRHASRAKRNSNGSFEHVEVHQDEVHDWENDSSINDSDRDSREDQDSPSSRSWNRRERSHSNEAMAGSSGHQRARDEGPRYKSHRQDKYEGEGKSRVHRKYHEAAYDDKRNHQEKYDHERYEEGGAREDAMRYKAHRERDRRSEDSRGW